MDDRTRREIDKACRNTLREAGIAGPPVRAEVVLEHLDLYRDFFNLQEPTFLDRTKHKIVVNGRKLIQIVKRICLHAVLFPDEGRIVIDSSLPQRKQEWPAFHEMGHRILVWHRPYFYGDTAQTLNPDFQQHLEEEANHAASTLMFCGSVFTTDARDTKPEWASVEALKTRYGKNYPTTLRRYVQFGPEYPMAMLVSTPSWMDTPDDQTSRCRHFVPSPQFTSMFSDVGPDHLLRWVDQQARRRRGGMVADFTLGLKDDRGELHEFHAESFFNTIYLQTLFVHVRRMNLDGQIVVPATFGENGIVEL